jgi:DNA-binding response OmpR family regulator
VVASVILAVCLDPMFPGAEGAAWRSAGLVVLAANSIKEAINHFKAGDFDLALLGRSIPVDARERLAFLIRATGSQVPVICIADSSGHHDSFADATFEHGSNKLLSGIGDILKSKTNMGTAPVMRYGTAN